MDSGHGTWEEDNTLKTTCHIGDEAATTNLPPISTTQGGNPTNPPVRCHRDGANGIGHCQEDFICCKADNGGWTETNCHCLNGFVYDEELSGICSFAAMCGFRTFADEMRGLGQRLGSDHECDGGITCDFPLP